MTITRGLTTALTTGHPAVIAMVGQQRPFLSRTKARKLAYKFKGSNLGARYRAYLRGEADGFWIEGKRLVREHRVGLTRTTVLHAEQSAPVAKYLSKEQKPLARREQGIAEHG